jgi:hypothetical protein
MFRGASSGTTPVQKKRFCEDTGIDFLGEVFLGFLIGVVKRGGPLMNCFVLWGFSNRCGIFLWFFFFRKNSPNTTHPCPCIFLHVPPILIIGLLTYLCTLECRLGLYFLAHSPWPDLYYRNTSPEFLIFFLPSSGKKQYSNTSPGSWWLLKCLVPLTLFIFIFLNPSPAHQVF